MARPRSEQEGGRGVKTAQQTGTAHANGTAATDFTSPRYTSQTPTCLLPKLLSPRSRRPRSRPPRYVDGTAAGLVVIVLPRDFDGIASVGGAARGTKPSSSFGIRRDRMGWEGLLPSCALFGLVGSAQPISPCRLVFLLRSGGGLAIRLRDLEHRLTPAGFDMSYNDPLAFISSVTYKNSANMVTHSLRLRSPSPRRPFSRCSAVVRRRRRRKRRTAATTLAAPRPSVKPRVTRYVYHPSRSFCALGGCCDCFMRNAILTDQPRV